MSKEIQSFFITYCFPSLPEAFYCLYFSIVFISFVWFVILAIVVLMYLWRKYYLMFGYKLRLLFWRRMSKNWALSQKRNIPWPYKSIAQNVYRCSLQACFWEKLIISPRIITIKAWKGEKENLKTLYKIPISANRV